MMRSFSRRLPIVAAILVLAVTVLATMASAGTIDKATPQTQVGNTGEVRMPAVQGKQITPSAMATAQAVVDTSPRMLPANTGGTQMYVFQGHDITPPADRGTGAILYAPSEADNATFRADVATCTGTTVDYFDASAGTPDATLLAGYDCVIVWANYPFADNITYGDNLAAFVDGGGKVILGQWTYPSDQGNYLAGAIMGPDYCPVTTSTSFDSGSYNLDGTDCVHDGIVVYSSDYLDAATLGAGASSDGTMSNPSNTLAVAWRDDRLVYYSPGNTGGTYGTGDWANVTCNMYDCSGGGGPSGPILYAPSEADNATFRADLAACTGVDVDYFDASAGTPDMTLLAGYGCVVVWANYPFADNVTYGDNLAAFVDGGGVVILGQWTYQSDQGNYLAGAIMGPDYCPVTTSTSFDSGSYNLDGTDCVHDGVAVYSSDYLDAATLASGAVSDGTMSNPSNTLAVAWRADRMVYYSPGNTGGTYGTGDWVTVTCNMYLCSGGGGTETMPMIITGPGNGPGNPPQVRVWDPNDSMAMYSEWAAYGAQDFGVNVACGDLDGDGIDEVVTGPGPGAVFGPHVRAFDIDGVSMGGVNLFAYGTLKYGVNVACGDVDDDGTDEIITGAGPGAVFGPHVRGWNVDGGTATSMAGINYFAYGAPKWGVNVACGDIDGDDIDEIVTGAGPGAVYGPHVRGWDVDGGTATFIPGVHYFAYDTLKYGVNVACGDFDGDGIDEIVTGAGPGVVFGSHVRGWNYDGGTLTSADGINFFAYAGSINGVQVALLDLDGDDYDELLTMPGPDAALPAQLKAWNVDDGTATAIGDIDVDAYSDMTLMYGGKVGGGGF